MCSSKLVPDGTRTGAEMKGKESRGHNSRARHSLVNLIRHSKANDGCVSLKLRTERPLKLRSCNQL